jgi:hypothetical protein
MRRLAVAFSASLAVAVAGLACGAQRLPAPAYVGHPSGALVQVPYPPPPARVEFVPDAPDDDAVWVDGEWVWQGRRYAWKPGRWVRAPANASFAPWTSVRDEMGTLYLAEGAWRDAKGNEVGAPKILKVGSPSPGTITDPEGQAVDVPAIQPPDASTQRTDGEATFDPRAPRDLIVDSGPEFPVDASWLPDGALEPSDGGLVADVVAFDATPLDTAATPSRRGATMVTP